MFVVMTKISLLRNILYFDLWFIMSFDNLGFEIFKTKSSLKCGSKSIKIRFMSRCLYRYNKNNFFILKKIKLTLGGIDCVMICIRYVDKEQCIDKRKQSHKWMTTKFLILNRTKWYHSDSLVVVPFASHILLYWC